MKYKAQTETQTTQVSRKNNTHIIHHNTHKYFSVSLCKNQSVGETWYEQIHHFERLIELSEPSESNKRDLNFFITLENK